MFEAIMMDIIADCNAMDADEAYGYVEAYLEDMGLGSASNVEEAYRMVKEDR